VTIKGKQIAILCTIEGNPVAPEHVTWKLKDKALVINRDTEQYYSVKFVAPKFSLLNILNARESDDGNVTCSVYNGIGTRSEVSIDMRVKREPQLQADASVLKAGQDSNFGHSALFKCVIVAYPEAKIKWLLPVNISVWSVYMTDKHKN
jgi:hypothetical protein